MKRQDLSGSKENGKTSSLGIFAKGQIKDLDP
jgi:hypothetical protein